MAQARRSRPWLLLLVIYVGFGSSFLAIEVTVRDLPPLTAAAVRFLVAGLILAIGLAWRRGWRQVVPAPAAVPFVLLAGVLLFLIGNGGVMLGQAHGTPSWMTALIVATIPVCVAVLRAVWGPPLSGGTVLGTVIGLSGTAVVLLGSARTGGSGLLSAVPVLVGAIGWATGTYIAARRGAGQEPVLTSAHQLCAGGAILLVAAAILEHSRWPTITPTWASMLALAWLIVVSSTIAMVAFYRVVALSSVSTASTYAFVNPVVATLLSGLIVGAWPDAVSAWAIPIVVAGVAMVVLGDRSTLRREGGVRDATTRSWVARPDQGADPAPRGAPGP